MCSPDSALLSRAWMLPCPFFGGSRVGGRRWMHQLLSGDFIHSFLFVEFGHVMLIQRFILFQSFTYLHE